MLGGQRRDLALTGGPPTAVAAVGGCRGQCIVCLAGDNTTSFIHAGSYDFSVQSCPLTRRFCVAAHVCMAAGRLASQIQALPLKMQHVDASSWACSVEGQLVAIHCFAGCNPCFEIACAHCLEIACIAAGDPDRSWWVHQPRCMAQLASQTQAALLRMEHVAGSSRAVLAGVQLVAIRCFAGWIPCFEIACVRCCLHSRRRP